MKKRNQIEQTEIKSKKRRKWPWILLAIVLILAVAITVLVKWQWNNIMAIHFATSYSAEDLEKMREENDRLIRELCEEISQVDLSLLPEEAQKLLQSGELSEEKAVAVLTGQITWEEAKEDISAPVEAPHENQVSRVDDIIAQIYVLRSGYVGKLDGLVTQAYREYKKGGITKQDLINRYVSVGYGLEAECDGKMEALLSDLTNELSRTGGDLSLVDTVRQTYYSEKSIKKAEMIAKYQK